MKKLLSASFWAIMVLTAFGLAVSCGPTVDPRVEVTSVSLSQTSVSLEVGGSVNLTATVSPSNATDKTVSWSSSNSGVATVSGGAVTAVNVGEATITASAGGKSATCKVTVTAKEIAVTGVSLNKTEITLTLGESFQLEATVSPADATDKTVSWSSSNSGVATVSGGAVTTVNVGEATITASAGGKSATCKVTVKAKEVAVTGVSLDKTEITLTVGESFQLEAAVSPADATDKTVSWSSSDSGVATVSDGAVTAVNVGEATITASAGGKSATCKVTVKAKEIAVTGVSLNKTEITLIIGETFQLEATVSPADATDKTVQWASSAPSLATVSENGLVKAVKAGTSVITATAGTVSATCNVTCVELPKVKSITFSKGRYSVQVGKTVQLEFTYSPSDAVNTDFTWSVADKDVAEIDKSGNLKGLAPGRTTVTVSADNGVSASVEVSVTIPGGNEEYGYEELN